MATWSEVQAHLGRLSARRLSDTAWVLPLTGRGAGRKQQIFVSYELMAPNLELLRILSPVSMLPDLDAGATIRYLGNMQIGMVGFSATDGTDGFVGIGSVIPLALLDVSDPVTFPLYLNIVAQAADGVEQQLGQNDLF